MYEDSMIYEDAINFYHDRFSVEWDDKEKCSLYNFLEKNNFSYREILFSGLCAKKNNKLEDRITKTTVEELKLGYADTDVRRLYNFLLSKGYTEDDILLSKLCYRDDDCIKDRFFRSIVFPVYNPKKELVALIAKRIDKGFSLSSYSVVLNCNRCYIINEFFCVDYIDNTKGYCIICDNYFDLIYFYNLGVKNAVCFFGEDIRLTEEQLELIKLNGNMVSLKVEPFYRREEIKKKLKEYNIFVL